MTSQGSFNASPPPSPPRDWKPIVSWFSLLLQTGRCLYLTTSYCKPGEQNHNYLIRDNCHSEHSEWQLPDLILSHNESHAISCPPFLKNICFCLLLGTGKSNCNCLAKFYHFLTKWLWKNLKDPRDCRKYFSSSSHSIRFYHFVSSTRWSNPIGIQILILQTLSLYCWGSHKILADLVDWQLPGVIWTNTQDLKKSVWCSPRTITKQKTQFADFV